ncbi:MAG: ABC transporter ATP-binding protein [Chloroflexi bacterium]|nr:MAG: ABC transporter ATP-binding protein [Actinobacteria bacterium 13_2_20CM_2_66_6]TMD34952.1 MAG: ABC transporter ATP-binding protein [Chloroflexota bacterium]TMD71970.1 MAG: ABC transporter ATP-binding protein [Chloroflexota bacterium]
MALLEVRDLHVFYGNIEALKGISLDAQPKKVVAILGANGAGKTTTLRTISGLLRPRSGSITCDGKSLVGVAAHVIVGLGLSQVPEGRRIFNILNVEENLNLGGYLLRSQRKLVKERKAAVFELFPRLAERRMQLAGTLSGGEQQMLAIGRALMSDPKVLMLDEPSLGLAPILARSVLKTVRRIADRGAAVLLVEQNARQALAIADYAYVIEVGRIALEGEAAMLARDERVQKAYLGGFESVGSA